MSKRLPDADTITDERAESLASALQSGRWFAHALWTGNPHEPFAYRWIGSRLEKARRGRLHDIVISERRFSPLEVMSSQWRFVRE